MTVYIPFAKHLFVWVWTGFKGIAKETSSKGTCLITYKYWCYSCTCNGPEIIKTLKDRWSRFFLIHEIAVYVWKFVIVNMAADPCCDRRLCFVYRDELRWNNLTHVYCFDPVHFKKALFGFTAFCCFCLFHLPNWFFFIKKT